MTETKIMLLQGNRLSNRQFSFKNDFATIHGI